MITIILSFIILIPLNSMAAPKGKSTDDESFIKPENIKLTELERKIAHNFNKLFKLAQKDIVNPRLLKNLEQDIQKSNTFFDYKIWPETLSKIYALQNISTAQSMCSQLSTLKSDLPVQSYLKDNITSLCAKKYLNLLAKEKNTSLETHQANLAYFKENLPNYLKDHNGEDLKYLLTSFEKEGKKHQLYSDVISNYIISNNITPDKELVRYMLITPELTKYIQSTELEENSTKNVFWQEFYKMTEDIREQADANSDDSESLKKAHISQRVKEAINYFNATLPYQPREKAFTSLLSLGKSMMRRGYEDLARNCYQRLLSESDVDLESVFFEYAWTYILNKDFDEVIKLKEKFIKPHHNIRNNSKLTFWLGYSHQQENNTKVAKELFELTIKENPLSYYAILSAKLLSGASPKDTEAMYFKVLEENEKKQEMAKAITMDVRWVKRILAWSYVGNGTFLDKEFDEISIRKDGFALETHILTAAYKLSENEDYLESFKMIYRSVDRRNISINKDTLKILFPKPYLSQIETKAKNFDPIIALSLIRQESGFNRFATSHVGARGLMQLMPDTARRIKRWVRNKHLYNPNTNIDIGTKFFDKLMSRYDNNLVYSLAAYNAGMRRIDDWQEKNYVNSEKEMLSNIENIPFLETRKYVKLIFRNIFFYKMLVGKNDVEDPHHLNKIYDIHLGFNR